MIIENLIKQFLEQTYSGDLSVGQSVLYGYEAFKKRKEFFKYEFTLDDTLYKEYAANFRNKIPVLCMLRNYEEFKAKQLIALN